MIRHLITTLFLFVFALSAAILGFVLVKSYTGEELKVFSTSLQVIIFIFTASAGFLALLKYWGSVEAELEQKRWQKFEHLEALYKRFRDHHINIIQAFDWPHILRDEYLPLCDKAIEYDQSEDKKQKNVLTLDEIARVKELDDFLEFFENLYFVIKKHLVNIDDILLYFQYYVALLGDMYNNNKDYRLKNYIDQYYYNIQPLLDEIEKHLLKHPNKRLERLFPNYPKKK